MHNMRVLPNSVLAHILVPPGRITVSRTSSSRTRCFTITIYFIFIENHPSAFLPEIEKLFGDLTDVKTDTFEGDVSLVPREGKAFVSPGNSMGFMDGGIDFAYSRKMFPGCQSALRDRIALLGKMTSLGRPYLPVGSAISVVCGPRTCLIAAPTMFLPHDVRDTRNAYHAFTAVLGAFHKFINADEKGKDIDTIVCPALCCGYGHMDPSESARQIFRAFEDYYVDCRRAHGSIVPAPAPVPVPSSSMPPPMQVSQTLLHVNDLDESDALAVDLFITRSRDDEQPDNFDNREIKAIHPALL